MQPLRQTAEAVRGMQRRTSTRRSPHPHGIVRKTRVGVWRRTVPLVRVVLETLVTVLHVRRWKVTMQVREIMTTSPVTCTPETSLGVAAGRMADSKSGILPVLDTRGRLVGIITDRDICLAISRTNRNALSISVREVMTRKVSSVQLTDDVRRALAMMRTARVRRVPVLDAAGHLEGVLSIDDIIGRGSNGDIRADEIVETLRDVYVRRPQAA
jgi:CBS domain-containing protein